MDDLVERGDRGRARQHRRLLVRDGVERLRERAPLKCGPRREHLEQQAADGKQIRARIDVGAADLLRRHIARRADDDAGERDGGGDQFFR